LVTVSRCLAAGSLALESDPGSPSDCRIASLYLDATFGVKVLAGFSLPAAKKAQQFPISAKRLPLRKRPGESPDWNTLKFPFFNSL
jgi:hypothetical protein